MGVAAGSLAIELGDCLRVPGPYDLGCLPSVLQGLSWPATPVESASETVTTKAEFDAAVLVNGNKITCAASTTFTGRLNPLANDLDIIMPNSSNLDGECELGNVSNRVKRFRWTGGNITTGPLTFDNADDVLFNNIKVINDGDINNNLSGQNANRVALINSTFENPDGVGGWAIFMTQSIPAPGRTDWIIANVKLHSTGQICRFQSIRRLVIIDSAFDLNDTATQSFRMQERCKDIYIRDLMVNGAFTFFSNAAPNIDNAANEAVIERFTTWGTVNSWALQSSMNSGTVNDCDSHRTTGTPGAEMDVSPMIGSNNLNIFWDGATLPDDSGFGADH